MRPYFQTFDPLTDENRIDLCENLCFPAHWHPECELIYVAEGEVTIGVNRETYQVCSGQLLAIGSNQIHFFQSHQCKILLSIFHPRILGLSSGWPQNGYFRYPLLSKEQIPPYILQLLSCFLQDSAQDFLTRRGLIHLACAVVEKNTEVIPLSPEGEEPYRSISKAVSYIEENYSEPLSLPQIASHVSMSPSHFSRRFKEYTGSSLPAHINSVRLCHAELMLVNTQKNISEIAYLCGFNSLRNFNRTFLEKYHKTPFAFRHENKKTFQKKEAAASE